MVDGGRRLLWHCFTDAKPGDVMAYLGLKPGQVRQETPAERRQRQELERQERARKLTWCGGIWSETQPAEGSPVEAYLRQARGIKGPIPAAVRFHPAAPLAYPWTEFEGDKAPPPPRPAMVAIATAEDGKSAAGLHVTALQPDGSGKAALRAPRRMFGDLGGAVVQLAPLPVDGVLAIAEGIETALAFRDLTGTPCWAALSTSGLRRFTPPRGLSRLIIAADSDDTGEGVEAARACAERASRICNATVRPAPEGQDWNDVLKGSVQ
jgi:putative DNA primase/helicase